MENETQWTVGNVAFLILLSAFLGFFSWMALSVIELQGFAAQGTRFTHADAFVMHEQIMEDFDKRYPPRWLVERVELHERRIAKLESEPSRSNSLGTTRSAEQPTWNGESRRSNWRGATEENHDPCLPYRPYHEVDGRVDIPFPPGFRVD